MERRPGVPSRKRRPAAYPVAPVSLLWLVCSGFFGAEGVQLRGQRPSLSDVEDSTLLEVRSSSKKGALQSSASNLFGGLFRIRAKKSGLYLDSDGSSSALLQTDEDGASSGVTIVTRPLKPKSDEDPGWMNQLWLVEEGLPNSYSIMQYSSGLFLDEGKSGPALVSVGASDPWKQRRLWFLQGKRIAVGEVDLETPILSAASLQKTPKKTSLSLLSSDASLPKKSSFSLLSSDVAASLSRNVGSSSSNSNSSTQHSQATKNDILELFLAGVADGSVELAGQNEGAGKELAWVFEKVESVPEVPSDGVYLLQNSETGQNMAARNSSQYESACEMRAAAVENTQHWILRRVLGEVYTLQQGVSGQLLGMRGGQVLTSPWSAADKSSQSFRLWRVAFDTFLLLYRSSGSLLVLDNKGGEVTLSKLTAASLAGNVSSQRWKLRKTAALPSLNGLYHLRQKGSGKVLSVQSNGELSLSASVWLPAASSASSSSFLSIARAATEAERIASERAAETQQKTAAAILTATEAQQEVAAATVEPATQQKTAAATVQTALETAAAATVEAAAAPAPAPSTAATDLPRKVVNEATVWSVVGLEGDELEISSKGTTAATTSVLGRNGTSNELPNLLRHRAEDSMQHWFAEKLDSTSYALRLGQTSDYLDATLLKDGSVGLRLAKKTDSASQAWELVPVEKSTTDREEDGTAHLSACPSFFECGAQDDWTGSLLPCGHQSDGSCAHSNLFTEEKYVCNADHSCHCIPKATCEGECGEEDDGCGGKITCGHYGDCAALDPSGAPMSCYPTHITTVTPQRALTLTLTVGKCCAPTVTCALRNAEAGDCWQVDDGCGKILTCGDCQAPPPAAAPPAPAAASSTAPAPAPAPAFPANYRCTKDGCHCAPNTCDGRCGHLEDGCGGSLDCSCDGISNSYCFEAEQRCIVISASSVSTNTSSGGNSSGNEVVVQTTTTTTIDYLPNKASIEKMYNYLYYFFFYYQYLSLKNAKVPPDEARQRSILLARTAAMDTLRGELNKMVPTTTTTTTSTTTLPDIESMDPVLEAAPSPAPTPSEKFENFSNGPSPAPGPVIEEGGTAMNATTRIIGTLLWDSLITRHALFDSSAVPEMLEHLRILASPPFPPRAALLQTENNSGNKDNSNNTNSSNRDDSDADSIVFAKKPVASSSSFLAAHSKDGKAPSSATSPATADLPSQQQLQQQLLDRERAKNEDKEAKRAAKEAAEREAREPEVISMLHSLLAPDDDVDFFHFDFFDFDIKNPSVASLGEDHHHHHHHHHHHQ